VAFVPGSLEEQTGALTLVEQTDGHLYGVTDEIARRAWMSGARVLAVRSEDLSTERPVAAILRYPL
jgi:hypothetical protein